MDKEKVANLANSFSTACKEAVKENKLIQKMSSPQAILLTLAVLEVTIDLVEPKKHWGTLT